MTTRGPALRRLGALVALLVIGAALAYCAWFRIDGGRWERVESPSMGTTAPVGTLLWVRSVDPATIQSGDVVTFHRPGSGAHGPVYSHRVTVMHTDGSFGTAGDLSGPDQWRVAPTDVVGRAVHVWPGVGWLVLAVPVLVIGGLLTCVAARAASRGRRRGGLPVVIMGAALTAVVVLVVYHPLTGIEQLGSEHQRSAGGHDVRVTFVSTGLLPVHISAPGAAPVRLVAGESGSVVAASGGAPITIEPDVPSWLWLALIGPCLAPALVLTGRRQWSRRSVRSALPSGGCHRRPQETVPPSGSWPFRATSANTSPS